MTLTERIMEIAKLWQPHEEIYFSMPIEYWQAMQEENARLLPLIIAMAKELERKTAALEFYGDKNNWGTFPEDFSSGTNALLKEYDKEHYSDVWVGARARQALSHSETLKLLNKEVDNECI